MLSPFESIAVTDAWLQKRFDAAVHALMRASGATKRSIRRNGWGASLLGVAAHALTREKPFTIWTFITLALYAGMLWHDDRHDERAEAAADTRSVADEGGGGRKLIGWFGLGQTILLWHLPPNSLGFNLSTLFLHFAWLFQGYLCGTSPQAPAKKRKVAPTAQMARTTC